jgi:hypothetical protein
MNVSSIQKLEKDFIKRKQNKLLNLIRKENMKSFSKLQMVLFDSTNAGFKLCVEAQFRRGNQQQGFKNLVYVTNAGTGMLTPNIYLTATPSRSAYNDNSLYAKVFRSVPYFNGKELSGEKYHKVVLYKFNTHPSLDDRISVRTKYGFNQAMWAKYATGDGYEFLLEAVVNIFDKFKLLDRGKKVAVMLPTIELIKKLKTDLEIQYKDKISKE